jgi:hypothetical protein
MYKTPCTDQIVVELIQVGGKTCCSEIHKLIHFIWNTAAGEGICFITMYKMNDEITDCSIHLSELIPYIGKISGSYHCGF